MGDSKFWKNQQSRAYKPDPLPEGANYRQKIGWLAKFRNNMGTRGFVASLMRQLESGLELSENQKEAIDRKVAERTAEL